MDNSQSGIAYVPAEKQFFTLEEVAKLLALAQWPEAHGQSVSYPLRVNGADVSGMVLTDEDNAALAQIWKRAKLSEPTFPMSLPEWSRYVAAFNRSKNRPAWSLRECVENDSLTNAMMRAAAEEQFTGTLQGAIRDGTVTARDPITRMPVRDVRVLTGSHGLLLSREDVKGFAAVAMIELRVDPSAAAQPGRNKSIAARCDELKAQGVRAWQKQVASEWGISTQRVRQIRGRLK